MNEARISLDYADLRGQFMRLDAWGKKEVLKTAQGLLQIQRGRGAGNSPQRPADYRPALVSPK